MKFKIARKIVCLIVFAEIISCREPPKPNKGKSILEIAANPFADTSIYLRVYVDKFDNITLNGNSISAQNIENRLEKLKDGNGIVFYSFDNASADPPKYGVVIDILKK